jgi:uncharacterized protein
MNVEGSASMLSTTQITESLQPVFREYGIHKAVLFGSYARGTNTSKSDIDLLFVMDSDLRFLDRIGVLLPEVYRYIRGPAIELLVYTPEELEQISHRPFIRDILREGIILYECCIGRIP